MRSGLATVTLTTTRQSRIVTANVAGKTATVTVALESAHRRHASRRRRRSISALTPATFTCRRRRGREHPRRPHQLGRRLSRRSLGAISAATHGRRTSTRRPVSSRSRPRPPIRPASANRCRRPSPCCPAQPPSVSSRRRRRPRPSISTCRSCARRSPATRRRSSATSGQFGPDATAPTIITTTGNQVQNSWRVRPARKIISVTVIPGRRPERRRLRHRQHRDRELDRRRPTSRPSNGVSRNGSSLAGRISASIAVDASAIGIRGALRASGSRDRLQSAQLTVERRLRAAALNQTCSASRSCTSLARHSDPRPRAFVRSLWCPASAGPETGPPEGGHYIDAAMRDCRGEDCRPTTETADSD